MTVTKVMVGVAFLSIQVPEFTYRAFFPSWVSEGIILDSWEWPKITIRLSDAGLWKYSHHGLLVRPRRRGRLDESLPNRNFDGYFVEGLPLAPGVLDPLEQVHVDTAARLRLAGA